MYIQRYKIRNVLDVFRRHLSTGPAAATNRAGVPASVHGEIGDDHRRYLMDRLSDEIVERLSRPDENCQSAEEPAARESLIQERRTDFTYTAIDENNRKISNTLPIKNLVPRIGR